MSSKNPRRRPIGSTLLFLLSALCAASVGHAVVRDVRLAVPLAFAALLAFLPGYQAQRRMRRLLTSGDVQRVLASWRAALERIKYPETMAPLMAATAYAANGWHDAARSALERAARGPAWDAAVEQRLFVEALLDTFEGDRGAALRKTQELVAMPIPVSGLFARRRAALLRKGMVAFARAFAHESEASDQRLLARAAEASPLVHWAMRYASAVVAIDHGKPGAVPGLLAHAPEWPKQSAFRSFHDELVARAEAAPARDPGDHAGRSA